MEIKIEDFYKEGIEPPKCVRCGGVLKPNPEIDSDEEDGTYEFICPECGALHSLLIPEEDERKNYPYWNGNIFVCSFFAEYWRCFWLVTTNGCSFIAYLPRWFSLFWNYGNVRYMSKSHCELFFRKKEKKWIYWLRRRENDSFVSR